MGAGFGYSRALAAAVAAGSSPVMDTSSWSSLAIDITVTANTGTAVFVFSRLGLDGTMYPVWTSGNVTTPQVLSASLSGSMSGVFAQATQPDVGVVLTQAGQLSWTVGTSVTFSASIVGRS